MSSSESISSFFKQTYEKIPKKGIVNVYGSPGCGKTYFFKTLKHIKFDHDILKTKEKTDDFMKMMQASLLPLVLDDFNLIENLPGVKQLKSGRVPFFIISTNKLDIDCVTHHFEFPKLPVEEFATTNNLTIENAQKLINDAKGNMTVAKTNLDYFECVRDTFSTSKEYVTDLINSKYVSGYLDRHMSEHGNTYGMIHENYIDYINDLESLTHISQHLSDAQMIDNAIYSDVSWDLMPFFNVSACLLPAIRMIGPTHGTIRPGSMWTKYSNMCMKANRLKRLRMHVDDVSLWALKANHGEKIPFDSYDLDSINQLSKNKIKPKILSSLKKCLREESK
jgi:energy-coupling factor transporter ATP-binding protein EcfA2